jgi:hypothetical protein
MDNIKQLKETINMETRVLKERYATRMKDLIGRLPQTFPSEKYMTMVVTTNAILAKELILKRREYMDAFLEDN